MMIVIVSFVVLVILSIYSFSTLIITMSNELNNLIKDLPQVKILNATISIDISTNTTMINCSLINYGQRSVIFSYSNTKLYVIYRDTNNVTRIKIMKYGEDWYISSIKINGIEYNLSKNIIYEISPGMEFIIYISINDVFKSNTPVTLILSIRGVRIEYTTSV